MNFPDAFRAQYFLEFLEKEIWRAEQVLNGFSFFSKSLSEILKEFACSLAIELDQLALPTIVFEIHKAKKKGLLAGNTSQERYVNFFINEKSYTKEAQCVLEIYPFLFEVIDDLIHQTFESLILGLKRYGENQEHILY